MNRQIRRLMIAMIAMFTALFINLNYLQIVHADSLAHDPRNGRIAFKQFSRPRGQIISADGVVLARSVPSNDQYKLLRQYPEGPLFAPVTGFFSFIYGSDGVESTYGDDLAAHRPKSLRNLREALTNQQHTNDVTLTLAKKLQQVATTALGNRKGSVVAINPADGSILAMVSYPSYDPNTLASHDTQGVRSSHDQLVKDPGNPMLPRSYRERYPPGSTFKPVTAAAVLDKKPELATKAFPAQSAFPLPNTNNQLLRNFGNERCGGTLPDLLRVSCNTGFAQLGLGVGAKGMADEAHAFGFGSKPPLDLPAAATSVFPDASAFSHDLPGLAKSAIGQQDVAATPLQMALIAAGIANKGVIMKPHVLAQERDDQGNVVKTFTPEPWMQATSEQTAGQLKDMMVNVVQRGTGTAAQIPGMQVAGKTGTAQTVGDHSHAWFIAFAPADSPQIAVAVIVESQPGLGDAVTGGRIAAPIAKQVIQAALS